MRKRKVGLFDVVDDSLQSATKANGSLNGGNSMTPSISKWYEKPYSQRFYEILEKWKTLPVLLEPSYPRHNLCFLKTASALFLNVKFKISSLTRPDIQFVFNLTRSAWQRTCTSFKMQNVLHVENSSRYSSSEQLTKPLPSFMLLVILKELSGGAHDPPPKGVVSILNLVHNKSLGLHKLSYSKFPSMTMRSQMLREDQTLVVSTQAIVDPLDDEIDSSCKNDLCPSSASPYNLNKVLLPIDKSTYTLVDPCANQGESTLVCELPTTSEDVNEDQLTHECIPLLEHMCGVLKKSQVSDGVYRVDLDGACDSLNILWGLLGRVSLFLNVSLLLKANVICGYGSDILGEERANLGLDPWLLLPFDPCTLPECGNFYTSYLMLGQDDKQCLIVGANEGRQGMDSWSNPFQEGEDDMSTTTRMDENECILNPSKEVNKPLWPNIVTRDFNLSVESLVLDSSLKTLDAWEIEVPLVPRPDKTSHRLHTSFPNRSWYPLSRNHVVIQTIKNFLHVLSSSSSASISHGIPGNLLLKFPLVATTCHDLQTLPKLRFSESGGSGRDKGAYNLEDEKIVSFYSEVSVSPISPPTWVTPSF
ncbi:hypothetical protein FXO37_27266 [Capsicum annuum]|nr:hypothetical protein FXO37_27266 [Capsicum annuum]